MTDFNNGKFTILYADLESSLDTPGIDIEVPGDFLPLTCLTENGFDMTIDQIDTTSKCSGLFKEALPGDIGWTMTGTGQAANEVLPSVQSYSNNTLFQLAKSGRTFWGATFDEELNSVRYGKVFISAFSESSPNNAAKTFSITLQGVGEVFDQTATT